MKTDISRSIRLLILLNVLLTGPAGAEKAVDFAAPDLDGRIHRLSDYRGKWVLVNYWATWCPPCREELPELEVFHDNHKDRDAVVLGLDMEDIDKERLREFVEEQFLSYPILLEGSRPKVLLGRVPGLPTSFLVSPEGEIVARQVGPVDRTSIEAFIEKQKRERNP